MRRHDVDWLRVLALGLLIAYHAGISFQPWAFTLHFPQNRTAMAGLWPVMAVINVWRIPILFLVSGMGMRFAMARRSWRQLLADRTVRLLGPLLFGVFCVCPVSALLSSAWFGRELSYVPNAGHLWFLANLFAYVVLLLPLVEWIRHRPDARLLTLLERLLRRRCAVALFAIPLVVEAWLVDPRYFALYALTPHGFWLGLVCFCTGFLCVSLGAAFWTAVERDRHGMALAAAALCATRMACFEPGLGSNPLLALESACWMLAIVGYGSRHLNVASRTLAYLAEAVYPVYILHLPVQFAISFLVLPLALPPLPKLLLLIGGTLGVSLLLCELVRKRVRVLRPWFGLRRRPRAPRGSSTMT